MGLKLEAIRKLGIFGGAFDPPHRAHRELVRTAVEQLGLDALFVLPTGQAWHKPQHLSSAAHRAAMARLQFGDLPRVHIDLRETQRAGATYTIDTLRELVAEHPGTQVHLIIGADQLRAFGRWRDAEAITRIAIIAIAYRQDLKPATSPFDEEIRENLPPGARWQVLATRPMPESATDVRLRVARGEAVDDLVGPAVAGYIAEHHLYLTP